jgi:hypothetical protein
MSGWTVFLLYAIMVLFDAFILAGTVWLVGWCGWSPWWFVVTILMCSGSSPSGVILAQQGIRKERK